MIGNARFQDFIARTEGTDLTIAQHEQEIALSERSWSVRHDDDNPATFLEGTDRLIDGVRSGRVEVGVWLIQNDHHWIMIEGARQTDALALTSRELCPRESNWCIIALWEPQNDLMGARQRCSADDFL